MDTQTHIRASLLRARDAFERRPSAALQEDRAATAEWQGGLATRLLHPSAPAFGTDLPGALGGGDAHPSPGWYFRAGLASCMASSIAMGAALQGIRLARLEVEAHSESDARGMLGTEGVPAEPLRFWLKVAIASDHASEAALRALVESAAARSPMTQALKTPASLEIEVDPQPRRRSVA